MTFFGRNTDAIAATLMQMQDQARIECKHDQRQMAARMADYMALDRRFDGIKDKAALAREAMSCRASGRQLDLTERIKSGATGPSGYVSRNV